jgi:AcrR family transcriptional regulator
VARQIERREETRARLLAAARAAFVAEGFEAASLERILASAAMSKGALYHHFASKEDLFAAVYEDVSRETIARARPRGTDDGDPFAYLVSAALAWLNAVEAPEPRAIILEQAPRALGFARARALEDSIALPPMHALVQRAAPGTTDLDTLLIARLLNAALTELALLRHASGNRTPNKGALKKAVAGIARGLLPADP